MYNIVSVITIEECEICERNNVVSINTDFTHQLPYQAICKRNRIPYSTDMVKALNYHFIHHLTTPKQAMALAMVREEAINLKNTVVEANIALDQVDSLKAVVYQKLTNDEEDPLTPKDLTLLVRSYTDLLKQQTNLLQFHHKISGKAQEDDLMQAALGSMISTVTKELGEEKIRTLRQEVKDGKQRSIMSFFEGDEHTRKLFEDLENQIKKNEKDTDYEVEDYGS